MTWTDCPWSKCRRKFLFCLNFYKSFLSQIDDICQGMSSQQPQKNKFCSFLYAFKEGTKEDYFEVRKRQRLDYRLVNKIMCFPEGGYFKDVLI